MFTSAAAVAANSAIPFPPQGNASGTSPTIIHFVLIGGGSGEPEWQQADGVSIARDIAAGEYSGTFCKPLAVMVADPVAGTCEDISVAVAQAILDQADCPVDSPTYDFLERHLGIVAAREARRIGDDEDSNFNARRAA